MARGDSGRIVIEVEPEAKRQLYAALDLAGSTLKEWFIKRASDFYAETTQPPLFNLTDLPVGKARHQEINGSSTSSVKSTARKNRIHRKRARSRLAT
jgi:hypothetical protein